MNNHDHVNLDDPLWDFEQPPRATLREFHQYWRQYWREHRRKYTDADKAFYAIDVDGQMFFYFGNTRIKVTEHFSGNGKSMDKLIEDLVHYAAHQGANYADSVLRQDPACCTIPSEVL